jgi:carbohydrate binding protein with CBM6 domain
MKSRGFISPLSIVVLLSVMLSFGGSHASAANNPLTTIRADTCDAKSDGIKTEPCSEGGTDLCSIHDGDYAEYNGFDFDSGVAALKIRLASNQTGTVEVRLDSPAGVLLGTAAFHPTGGWQSWADATCNVDNSQSGVRNVFLVFHGPATGALLNVSQFVFLKSTIIPGESIDLSGRLDVADDEPQATKAWGMPETGFTDDFADGTMSHWTNSGLTITDHGIDGGHAAAHTGSDLGFAYTPDVYINKTDTGGEWRTQAEASLAADIVIDSQDARPGIGFSSKDGKQWVYAVLNPSDNSIEARRKLSDGTDVVIHEHPKFIQDLSSRVADDASQANVTLSLQTGVKYRMQMDWSPYSNGMIVMLYDDKGTVIANFRTVIDLPAARRPLLVCSGGDARFGNIKFDPTLDGWDYKWQWYKTPVLGDDVCNPAVWKGKDGNMYMVWRKFGADTFHGIASSPDGIHWTRVSDETLKCTGDMNVVVDPFGDGLIYVTPGGGGMPWFTTDGSNNYTVWNKAGINVGDIFGNCRIQEIIDTKRYPQMSPISYDGTAYRFIAYVEDWNRMPKPHSVVLLSNTLDKWVLPNPDPVIPPTDTIWGEKGNALGAAYPLPDGNLLLADCACTWAGYTGAPEPSNVSAIADGKQPWKILKLGTLPDAPVSREAVWYQGPNFGTAYYYDEATDTLFFYGGFHDYRIGMMRAQHFLHPVASAAK